MTTEEKLLSIVLRLNAYFNTLPTPREWMDLRDDVRRALDEVDPTPQPLRGSLPSLRAYGQGQWLVEWDDPREARPCYVRMVVSAPSRNDVVRKWNDWARRMEALEQ